MISTLISIFHSLSMIFSETYFSRYNYSIKWANFIVSLPVLLEISCSTCKINCYPDLDVTNFDIYLSYLAVFLPEQKFETKIEISPDFKYQSTFKVK